MEVLESLFMCLFSGPGYLPLPPDSKSSRSSHYKTTRYRRRTMKFLFAVCYKYIYTYIMGSNIFLSKFIGNLLDMYTMYIYCIYKKKKNRLKVTTLPMITGNMCFNELINSAIRTIGAFRGCSEHGHKETKL